MTGFSVGKDGSMSGGLEDWATSAGKAFGKARKLFNVITTGFEDFQNLDEAIRGSGTSFNDYIKYLSRSEDATEAFGLATLYTRARVLLLNMALSTGLALAASLIVKKIAEASQSIETNATKSKEAADAAQSTTSSLKDLVSAYEELGDKSGWDAEDFDQAKDIQAEILDLAKEQGTLDEDKLGKLDLQNGKYEEQLGLLQDITAEQLEASRYELTQNKDAQGDKLVDTAKKNNRTHYLTVWSAPEMDMGDQIKNAGIDIFNKFGGYGPDDLNDADSIVDYYNEVGKALKYIIDNTTDGLKSAKFPHMANVDEQGPEMLVRQPQSGRYTYLETGDGVVPADITSRLFEMGGNPDAWFQKQMAKYGSQPIVQGGGGDVTTSIGDIIITNPVGSSDALANEIKQKLPTKVAQMQSKR